MSNLIGDSPAFPQDANNDTHGMTLRMWLAGQALTMLEADRRRKGK